MKRAPSTFGAPSASGAPMPVLDPDGAAMRLDDLLGDRQAEAGILAEALMRPVGVKALENLLDARRAARPARRHRRKSRLCFSSRRQVTRTVPPGGENERAFSIRLSTTWPRRESWPGTWNARAPPPSNFERDLDAVVALHLVGDRDERVEELGEIDRRGLLALQLGIEAAGVGNIGDQPIEPLDVVLDDVEQPRAALVGLGDRQRLHRRTQRGQRIFQFMRDVGGKALDAFDAADRARWSCRAACPTGGRSRRGGG